MLQSVKTNKVWEFDVTTKIILNSFKKGSFSNRTGDVESEDTDVIFADLKVKCKKQRGMVK